MSPCRAVPISPPWAGTRVRIPSRGNGGAHERKLAPQDGSAPFHGPQGVELHLPRFRVESAWSVVEALRLLGIGRIFAQSALAVVGVATDERLYISAAYHAAVLRVDECGVEEAAGTAMTARRVSAVRRPSVELRVDRPFLFLVTHREAAAVNFLGLITAPR